MKKTLGGDRLGSGKRMSVELHGYERSTHDLGYLWRSTMAAGTLVPFMSEVALPGDTFDINLNCDIKTHPTIGPLFGSYKVQLDVFQAPIRLYNSLLHNNKLNIGMNMSQVKFPIYTMVPTVTTDNADNIDTSQINPSCLLAYLGLRGVAWTEDTGLTRAFNAIPLLAYWEIYKQYYANKQEEIGAVLHTPSLAIVQTVDDILIAATPLTQAPVNSNITIPQGTIITVTYTGASPILSQLMILLDNGQIITVEDMIYVTNTPAGSIVGVIKPTMAGITVVNWDYRTGTDINTGRPAVATFDLGNIDAMREGILEFSSIITPFDINTNPLQPYRWLVEQPNDIPNVLSSQEGLGLKTYQSDLFNNWLQTEWIDGSGGITEITAIDTTGGSFTLDTLNLSKKVYDMLNRIAVSGGSYDDWLDAVYTHDRYTRCENPMYMGGLIKELVFQEVISNSESGDQPLGTMAGRGILAKKHKGGQITIKVDEPSYIIGIVSLTPRIDYSQGNKWDVHLQTIDDLHKPALDEIGFQELITEQMAWWDTRNVSTDWVQRSAGKQPAWINYMTNVNQTYGNFAVPTSEMFMTLNRRFEYDETTNSIGDLTTYIDPSKFNFIFAQTALDAQNFWTQIAVDITARRKMSAKVMPNL